MNTLSIQIPDSAVAVFGSGDDGSRSILAAAVVKWFELGRVSQGKASEILGLSRAEFLELLASYRVSAWQYSAAELDENLALIDNEDDFKPMIAAKLYESGTLSLGQAAELAGVSKREFMGMLGKFGVSIFNYPTTDLDRDIANAKDYSI